MRKTVLYLLPLFIFWFLCSSFAPATNQPDDIMGVWLVGEGQAKIEVVRVGQKYYGKMVWLKKPVDKNGNPPKDIHNPDASKRNNPLIGLELLRGFVFDASDNEWEGYVYDPESGKTYNCIASMPNKNTLNVRGYIGFSWIGRTDTWTRTTK